jgi:hypothetical protein
VTAQEREQLEALRLKLTLLLDTGAELSLAQRDEIGRSCFIVSWSLLGPEHAWGEFLNASYESGCPRFASLQVA